MLNMICRALQPSPITRYRLSTNGREQTNQHNDYQEFEQGQA